MRDPKYRKLLKAIVISLGCPILALLVLKFFNLLLVVLFPSLEGNNTGVVGFLALLLTGATIMLAVWQFEEKR